jgi:hypothetical protein
VQVSIAIGVSDLSSCFATLSPVIPTVMSISANNSFVAQRDHGIHGDRASHRNGSARTGGD